MKVLLFYAVAFALFYASSLSAVNGDTHEATPSEHARHRPVVTRPAKARPEHPPSLDKNLIAHIKRTLPRFLKPRLALLPFPFEVFFSQDRDDQQNVLQTLDQDANTRSFYYSLWSYLSDSQDQIVKEVRRYMLRHPRLHPKFQDMAVRNAIDRMNRHSEKRTKKPATPLYTKAKKLQNRKDLSKPPEGQSLLDSSPLIY